MKTPKNASDPDSSRKKTPKNASNPDSSRKKTPKNASDPDSSRKKTPKNASNSSRKKCPNRPPKQKKKKTKKTKELFPNRSQVDLSLHRIKELLLDVLPKLADFQYLEDFVRFFELVAEDKYPLSCIALPCFLDTVKWYSLHTTTSMVYRDSTRLWWRITGRPWPAPLHQPSLAKDT